MKESFLLSFRAFLRGHVLTLLLAAVALVHGLFPALVRGDGTEAGWREMFLRAVPGFVVAVTLVAVLAMACGIFARERENHRLALAVVRPASAMSVAIGRWLAILVVAALALTFNSALVFARFHHAPDCRHHLAPVLPPPLVVAQKMMDEYLKDPSTPEEVRKAPRSAVLSLLANKESDRYDVIPAGGRFEWPFVGAGGERAFGVSAALSNVIVRVCFASANSLRMTTRGTFSVGALSAAVSNDTQSVVEIPLMGVTDSLAATNLVFANAGTFPVMLRARRDIELLLPGDTFAANLVRATVQSFATLALLAAFCMFLSASLSRPVAIFTALVLVLVAIMAPNAVEQFPDELGISLADRIGLGLSRGVSMLTAAFAAPSPVGDVATGRCIEWSALARTALEDILVWPTVFLALSAYVVRRRPIRL